MEERKKESKTYRYETDVIKHAESNPLIPSFAEWACDRYRQEFMEIETLANKMQMYTDMANSCKDRLVELKKEKEQGKDTSMFNTHELHWIKTQAPERIKRSTFEGVYKAFCNQFKRQDINRRQFRLLVDRFDPKKQENGAKMGKK